MSRKSRNTELEVLRNTGCPSGGMLDMLKNRKRGLAMEETLRSGGSLQVGRGGRLDTGGRKSAIGPAGRRSGRHDRDREGEEMSRKSRSTELEVLRNTGCPSGGMLDMLRSRKRGLAMEETLRS